MKSVLENGDLIFIDGELKKVDSLEDVEQSIKSILSTRKGEFFLDEEFGLDYSNLERKNASNFEIEADIRDAISQEKRVTEITKINICRDDKKRYAKIDIYLIAEGGEVEIEGVTLGG